FGVEDLQNSLNHAKFITDRDSANVGSQVASSHLVVPAHAHRPAPLLVPRLKWLEVLKVTETSFRFGGLALENGPPDQVQTEVRWPYLRLEERTANSVT